MLDLKELRAAVRRLPEHDRAALAAMLLESLPMPAFAEEALVETARSRFNEIAAGETQPATWEAFSNVLTELGLA